MTLIDFLLIISPLVIISIFYAIYLRFSLSPDEKQELFDIFDPEKDKKI